MAVGYERTGFEWMDAAFEWLITPFNFSRLGVSLWGVMTLMGLLNDFLILAQGPPPEGGCLPIFYSGLAFCWLDENPVAGYLFSVMLWIPSVVALVLVWIRPRFGFLLAAAGVFIIWFSPTFHHHFELMTCAPQEGRLPDWKWLIPGLWFILAAWKPRPRRSPSPNFAHGSML